MNLPDDEMLKYLFKKTECKYCGSKQIVKRGSTSACNQRYYCKDCKRFFVIDDMRTKDEIKYDKRPCKFCKTSQEYVQYGKTVHGDKRFKCNNCGRVYSYDKDARSTIR